MSQMIRPGFAAARRMVLKTISAFAAIAAGLASAQSGRAPTPEDDLGPFYPPDWSGEIDADLTRFGGRVAEGGVLRLAGTVSGRDGRVVAGAVVEIWQTDARGKYRHPGVPAHQRDPGFQGYGRAMTDEAGRYEFVTIVPGRYGTRPPHIHLRLAKPGRREFVTQIYFKGDNGEGGLGGIVPAGREALSVETKASADGSRTARFDIVVPG
jgi:protocatechuate 3,4-dioxygenase beta subunit